MIFQRRQFKMPVLPRDSLFKHGSLFSMQLKIKSLKGIRNSLVELKTKQYR